VAAEVWIHEPRRDEIERMRSSQDVAKRCLCLELVAQRIALEHQAEELGPDAATLHEGLLAAVDELALEPSFFGTELPLLRARLGTADLDDPTLDAAFADLAILLWCLGRIEALPTVEQLMGEEISEVLSAGYLASAEGDLEAVEAALRNAKLRPKPTLDSVLEDVAKANALAISTTGEPSRDIPPGTVFYVLPWLRSTEWPWGQPASFEADAIVGAGGLSFSLGGVKPSDHGPN
jgi:hypothetical protein